MFARQQRLLVVQLRDAQAGLADRARVEERNRIAGEMHDVIGHALTVSLLHVSSARLALDDDPAEAKESLAEAERLAQQSLAEVRAAVGLMRGHDPSAVAPMPGAGEVAELVDSFRRAGTTVELAVDGDLGSLGATLGLAVYRIVQESLTNASRHAAGSAVTVRIDVGGGDTTVTVVSDGAPGPEPREGSGVLGMRERAEALGGRLRRRLLAGRLAGRGGASVVTDKEAVRVLLVDDQELIRAGLRGILRTRYGFEIVGELDSGEGVVEAVAELAPDVVVMDVRMPRVDGVTATRLLRAIPDSPPVLVLTTFEDEEILAGALRAGAAGFLLKGVPAEDLQRAVRMVAAGDSWLDPAVTGRVLAAYRDGPAPALPGPAVGVLTPREREVLALIGAGLSNTEIAAELVLGEGTIKTHVGHIFAKLDLRDRSAAVVFAFDHGLVQPGGSR